MPALSAHFIKVIVPKNNSMRTAAFRAEDIRRSQLVQPGVILDLHHRRETRMHETRSLSLFTRKPTFVALSCVAAL